MDKIANISEIIEHLDVLNRFAKSSGCPDEIAYAWSQGYISALVDYDLITEEMFDELLKHFSDRIH